jgi:hypothetical protein
MDRTLPVPAGTTSWTMRRPVVRFGVYRGNVAGALREALAARYPVVLRLVGEAFFSGMSLEYARRGPPRSPVLIHYGGDFPSFIAGFPPAASVPYLADVARLESAHWEAYHARDGRPAQLEALAYLDPAALAETRFEFLSSVRIVRSPFPIIDLWSMNLAGNEPHPLDLGEAHDALLVRPDLQIEVRRLPPGAASFLSCLLAGSTLTEAVACAQAQCADFDLVQALAGLVRARLVSRVIS